MVEKALVDVADLLDVKGSEGEAASLSDTTFADLENLEGGEDGQDGAVIDRERFTGHVPPRLTGAPTFEERVAVRVEEAAAVSRDAHLVVGEASPHGAEGCGEAGPGRVPGLEGL